MISNVYTKNEILQSLSSREKNIDNKMLDEFLKNWHIEAIFEDAQGNEFFDENAFKTISENIFTKKMSLESVELISLDDNTQSTQENNLVSIHSKDETIEKKQDNYEVIDIKENETPAGTEDASQTQSVSQDILNQLPDGMPLLDSEDDTEGNMENNINTPQNIEESTKENIEETKQENQQPVQERRAPGILEGAMGADFYQEQENNPIEKQQKTQEIIQSEQEPSEEPAEIDDISLLSESFEAQEKLRQYVVSELAKKNLDITSKGEFKIDVSEKTLNMIARAMAKKIAKYVCQLCAQDLGSANNEKLAQAEKFRARLEKKVAELESQNKKLRLLLTESNKNLNSYKPSIFGLYKKVQPKK